MMHLNNNKKNSRIVTASTFLLTLAATTIILVVASTTTATIAPLVSLQPAEAQRFIESGSDFAVERKLAPAVVSGDNIYIAWSTNNTENGNDEVMFRASNDGGASFGDKINLSNTTDADSSRVEIAGDGDTVIVTWWETNQTSDTPVARISADGGQIFGPVLRLAPNGTITE
jgi:hypothetical protein